MEKRIHILNGFALIFDALDEIIRIIRRSDGKADAAKKIMKRFPPTARGGGLDEEQTDAILELKLYRLAKLEINLVLDELKKKKKRAREIRKLLAEDTKDTNASGRWQIVRKEIESLSTEYGKGKDNEGKRRTVIKHVDEEPEYTAEDFIVAEDCHVLVTTDGWVKRQKMIADPSKSRLRKGDKVLACVAGSTRETIGFFSSLGVCYTSRMIDIPASTGFGDPIQKLFKMKDGEKIVAAMSFDPRVIGDVKEDPKQPDLCPETHGLAASSNGFALAIRVGVVSSNPPLEADGATPAFPPEKALSMWPPIDGSETILRHPKLPRDDLPRRRHQLLVRAGKGVTLIRLASDDKLIGFKASTGDRDLLTVQTNRGAKKTISTAKYRVTSRGGRGNEIQKNGKIAEIIVPPPAAPPMLGDQALTRSRHLRGDSKVTRRRQQHSTEIPLTLFRRWMPDGKEGCE